MVEAQGNKVLAAGFVPPEIHAVIKQLADDEGRTFSNALCRLLEEHPRVKRMLRERNAPPRNGQHKPR